VEWAVGQQQVVVGVGLRSSSWWIGAAVIAGVGKVEGGTAGESLAPSSRV
jgi:hypothetical protein